MSKWFTFDYNGNGFEAWETAEKAKSMAKIYMEEAKAQLGHRIVSEVILWGEILEVKDGASVSL